jgi:hypothetical protein
MNWYDYFVLPVLSLFFGYFGTYLKFYSKEKGKNLATKEDIKEITKETYSAIQEFKDDLGSEKFIEKQLEYVKEFWFEFSKMHNDLYRNYARLSQLMLENPSDAPKYAEEIKILKGSTRVKIMMMRGYKLFLTKRTGDVLEKYFSGIDTENALDQMFDPSLDKIYYELFESLRKDIANLMSREMKINDYFL